jgi:hypothetical protein
MNNTNNIEDINDRKTKKCKEGKELNPKTSRCVNICPPNFTRNDDFKCVSDKKKQIVAPKQ